MKKFRDWIDTGVIDEVVTTAIEDSGLEPTEIRKREVWLLLLQDLWRYGEIAVEHIKERGEQNASNTRDKSGFTAFRKKS